MAEIKILCDSSCDLPAELIEEYKVEVIPFLINLDGRLLKDDGVEVNAGIIYEYVENTGSLPGTVGVPVEVFRSAFEKWVGRGFQVICHTISSDFSSSYLNAKVAAEGLDGVWVLDTRSLSTGVGMLAVHAAELARRGMAAKEITAETASLIPKAAVTFVLDTLDYMKKGGRCSAATALGANLFRIKPMIEVTDGKMEVGRKFRGPLEKVLAEYIDFLLAGHPDCRRERAFITHTGCSRELIAMVRGKVEGYRLFDRVYEARAGATVTSHSGPNTLGLLYFRK